MFRSIRITAIALALTSATAAQQPGPGPYTLVDGWGALPNGMQYGETPGMTIDKNGKVFAFHRGSPPVVELDASGKILKMWGENMFVWPHGIRVDRNGFLWITDGRGQNGKGQQVFKFDSSGKLVMTLGTAGVSGEGPDTFNGPTDVAVAPNGDVFVSDGHVNNDKMGVFVGSARDGSIKYKFEEALAEGVAVDARGNIYVGETVPGKTKTGRVTGHIVRKLAKN